MLKQEKIILLIVSFFLIVEFFLSFDLPFFWDAVTKSSRADWIYSNNFSTLLVPTNLNSGHPPLWIASIALFWTIFGKAIWSARLLLLIVNIGVFYQLLVFARKNFQNSISLFLVFLVFIEPTLVAQTTNLNNDMLLLFFTLLGLNSLFSNGYWLYAIALTGLLLTNLRGIYCLLALAIIHIWFCRVQLLAYNKKMLRAYIIAIAIFIGFLFYQYSQLGWILISESNNYKKHREVAGILRIGKNAAAFIKNLLDFGRFAIWIPLLVMVFKFIKMKKFNNDAKSYRILIALAVFTCIFFVGFVPFSNPMGPRYFMICFILANFLFINLLCNFSLRILKRKIAVFIIIFFFVTGHLWIYPSTISQGWDGSLSYLNYFKQEEQMLQFLKEEQLETSRIGTNIPLNTKWLATLNLEDRAANNFQDFNIKTNEYILFSNIENRTENDDIHTLKNSWKTIKTFSQLGVFITLYKNPN